MSDRDAVFTEFVVARRTHLRRVAYAVCGDWHRADDILQGALTKLYVAWPRLREANAAEAYVRKAIVTTTIDESRRPWRREQPVDEIGDRPGGEGSTYDERARIFDALQALPEMQRKVVVLRHWLGLSVDETAADLGISSGTVKSHSSRGVAALRQTLAEV